MTDKEYEDFLRHQAEFCTHETLFSEEVLPLAQLYARDTKANADPEFITEVFQVDDKGIRAGGKETWRGGGWEHHEVYVPRQFIVDPEFRERVRQEEERRQQAKAIFEADLAARKEASEREELARLKAKYEQPDPKG